MEPSSQLQFPAAPTEHVQECARCGSLFRSASNDRRAPRCSYAFLISYPTQFPVSARFLEADYNSQHAKRLASVSFRSMIRLHFPESRGTGTGGARGPRARGNWRKFSGGAGRGGEAPAACGCWRLLVLPGGGCDEGLIFPGLSLSGVA